MNTVRKKTTSTETTIQLQVDIPLDVQPQRFYVWGFLLTIILWFSLIVIIGEILAKALEGSLHEYALLSSDIFIFIAVGAYIALLVESFMSPVFTYLRHLYRVEDVIEYIRRVRASPPEIYWSCESYHYETRTRWVTEYYTEYETRYNWATKSTEMIPVQKSRQKQETYIEKVVTHRESQDFNYEMFEDISGEITDAIFKFEAIKIQFTKCYKFGNKEIRNRYKSEKSQMVTRNKPRDTHFSFYEELHIADFKEKMLSIVDLDKVSWFMKWPLYILTTLLGCSWLHRFWFEKKTVYGKYMFVKLIY